MKAFAFVFLISVSFASFSQSTFVFEPDYSVTPNPERGFYHHTEVQSDNYIPLNLNVLNEYVEEESITQILRVFYLSDFKTGSISKDYLKMMDRDFQIAKEAGVKVIPRFAYTKKSSRPYGDATPEIVRLHTFQLREIFAAHTDVIQVVQAGFIGAWGEWYYTDHFAEEQPWIVSDENWEDRKQLVDDLLKVIPEERMLQIRTPGYKMTILDSETTIASTDAYDGSPIARLAHHNDCFVASETDFGTYQNIDEEKEYLEAETTYLAMGGETCNVSPPISDCDNAYAELQRFHWSYLNIDYNKTVLDQWRDQGCFDDVELNLGYNYIMSEATIHPNVHPEGSIDLEVVMQNHGFANPYNPKVLEVVLESTSENLSYAYKVDQDIRLLPINEQFTINVEAGFPDDIQEGTYKVYLNIADDSGLKNNPAYSIRFKNQETWNPSKGWNELNLELQISKTHTSDTYTGSERFVNNEPVTIPTGPKSIYYGSHNDYLMLFWAKSTTHTLRFVERSTDGISFERISSHAPLVETAKLFDHDQAYYYRFALLNSDNQISYSDTINVAGPIANDDTIEIVTDSNDTDWRFVLPTASIVGNNEESHILRTYFSPDKLHMTLYGDYDDYAIYLNTDNEFTTGSQDVGILLGMDYKLENNQVFYYEGSDWTTISTDILVMENNLLELELGLEFLENLLDNRLIPIVALLNADAIVLSDDKTEPVVHVRDLPPSPPLNLSAKNSDQFPGDRIEISWDLCQNCEGYIVEFSEDGVSYEVLGDSTKEDNFFNHDFPTGDKYWYRVTGFNCLGYSDYSNVAIVNLSTSTDDPFLAAGLNVWPNPGSENMHTNFEYRTLAIYNNNGQLVKALDYQGLQVDINFLPQGIYLFKFDTGDTVYSRMYTKM